MFSGLFDKSGLEKESRPSVGRQYESEVAGRRSTVVDVEENVNMEIEELGGELNSELITEGMTVTNLETCSRNKGKAIIGEENRGELISVQNSPKLKHDVGKDAIDNSWDSILTQPREQARTLQDGLRMDIVLRTNSNTEQPSVYPNVSVLRRIEEADCETKKLDDHLIERLGVMKQGNTGTIQKLLKQIEDDS